MNYTLDVILTQLIILPLTILSWRSLWYLYDSFWLPSTDDKDSVFSDVVGLIAGWGGCVLLQALEVPLTSISTYLASRNYYLRLVFEDIIVAAAFCAMIGVWRCGWRLHTTYILALDPVVSSWINFIASSASLLIMQLFSNGALCGCTHDCYPDDDVTRPVWTNRFLRHYARRWATPRIATETRSDARPISELRLNLGQICEKSATVTTTYLEDKQNKL